MPSGGNFTNCNCGPDTPICAQPTEPVATVGLCLADGTPIAVTVVRDCTGTVTSEGWINLTSGAWSAGSPPTGTIACGDSRSIQVSGTFCDIDDDGQVLGLVLIEYAYAADGSIEGVRLVDAVTGDTYAPQGEVTTCPAGVEQPERDLVQLCDTNDDESGTVQSVPFLRDYARDETGQITGHSDYTLDGAPYTVTGTAGICPEQSDCRDCQTLTLCDTPLSTEPAPLHTSGTGPQSGTTASGVGWSTSSGTSSDNPDWFPLSLFPVATTGPFVLTLDRPSTATWSARVGTTGTAVGRLIMPAGTELVDLSPLHQYDPVTRTLSPAPGAGPATANGQSVFTHRGPVTALTIQSDGTGGLAATQRSVGAFLLAPATVPFLRTTCRDCTGLPLDSADTLLDGVTPYEPTGRVGVCHPPEAKPCASTVSTMRLCDLNPDAEPDEQGRRCAVPFLRHLVHDCTGALAETRDTAMDGVTAYAPVQVVDCGAGLPAMVEVPWEVTAVELDPDAAIEGRGWLYSLSPVDDPDLVGVMRVTLSTTANTVCPGVPPQVSVHNPATYRYEPDDVLREHATYIRVDLQDFDNFEPVTGLSPAPNRLGGTAYWDGTTIRPTVNNGTGELYYDGPPASWQLHVGNTGGGTSCSELSFAAVSLRPEGCCTPCGESSGEGSTSCETITLCDVQPEEPGDPLVDFTELRLSDLPDGPTSGTLPNGVGYTVSCGSWLAPQGHYTIYPAGGPGTPACDQVWTFDQPVYLRFGVRGFNVAPRECIAYESDGGGTFSIEFLHPNHRLGADPDSICGLGSATDESVVRTDGPVTELTIRATTNVGAGRGLGLLHVGRPADPQPDPGSVTPFLRTVCRDGAGAITSTADTTLDGAPYTPAGTVTVCPAGGSGAPGPCRDTSSVLLCDLEPGCQAGTDPTATDEPNPAAFNNWTPGTTPTWCHLETPGQGAPVWAGGSAVVGPDPACPTSAGGDTHRAIGVRLAAGSPSATGTVSVTVSLRVTNDGPNPGYVGDGRFALWDDTAAPVRIAFVNVPPSAPVGAVYPLTLTASVPAAALAAGNIVAVLDLETYHGAGPKAWTVDDFAWSADVPAVECETQFLRTIVRDCQSGETVAVVDTTLDGQPYEVTGDVAQCTTAGGEPTPTGPRTDTELLALCDTSTDGTVTAFLRRVLFDSDGEPLQTTDTLLDGITLYTPTGTVGVCAGSGEPCRDSSSTMLCDTVAQEPLTVFDPAARPGADGWEIVSYTGYGPGYGPEAALPYPVPHPAGSPAYMSVRSDMTVGPGVTWPGYDAAPVRWVMRKTFTAPEDGVAVVSSTGFRGDGGARVRVNGIDAGMYGQWNQPATTGTAQIPVTAGPNTVEIEVRDSAGPSWITGRLDIVMARTLQFMRRTVVDCESGETVAVVDTTLDGQPYEVTGDVGRCEAAGGGDCCEQPAPETRVDVETTVLCVQDADGETVRQVLVERVYDDQSGDLLVQRLTDPATGEEVELPAGAELVVCQEPACPVAFSTECVGVVERTEASYDNTSMIGGVPGQCGGVQGPGGQFPCQPTGPLTITSWIVNGEEVIGDGGRAFNGGPCGDGTAAAPGMHRNWSAALTNLDPSGATWSAQTQPACAWYVGSTGGTQTTYGPMVVEDATGQQWTLTPAQSCQETQFTKVYTQQCDGSVSVSWLDADGEETAPPDGEQVPCGTGCGTGGGRGLDVEPLLLCDIAEDGPAVQFLRHFSYGSAGQVIGALDTALDGFTPYTPVGIVTGCQPDPAPDVEVVQLCDTVDGADPVPFLRHLVYTGEAGAPTVLDTALDGTTPYAVAGTVGACSEPCTVRAVIEQCRYDDTDGDGAADETYVELLGVDCEGALTSLGTYTEGLAEPYTPVSPVGPPEDGPDPVTLVEPHRVELAPGQSWSAASVTLLQAVTATAHGGTGQITTAGGTSTLYEGESVSWSVIRDGDTSLTGPLTVTAGPGTVTVSYTRTTTS
ncbi:hypothetical protein [Streptomyces bacillaris]|uniref:hypothetical protein n=1 Tax=Streptomyces bacillaris TaxID=68179 RepID=UPI003641B601